MSSIDDWPAGIHPDPQPSQPYFQQSLHPSLNEPFDLQQQQPHQHQLQHHHHHHHHQQQQQQEQALSQSSSSQQNQGMYSTQQMPPYHSHQSQQQLTHLPNSYSSTTTPPSTSTSSPHHWQGHHTPSRASVSTLSSAFGGSQIASSQQSIQHEYLDAGVEGSAYLQSADSHPAAVIMTGMGVDLPSDPGGNPSIMPLSYIQIPVSTNENQQQHGYGRSNSATSSVYAEAQYDIYGGTSGAGFANGSSAGDRHGLPYQHQVNAPYHQQGQTSTPFDMESSQHSDPHLSTHRVKKLAALQLDDTHLRSYTNPTWVGHESSTPNASSSYSQGHFQDSQPAPSPTWQQQQQQHESLRLPSSQSSSLHQYDSSSLLSPLHIDDATLSEAPSSGQSGMFQSTGLSIPHPSRSYSSEQMRPVSSASGASLHSGSSIYELPAMSNSDNYLAGSQCESSQESFFHHANQPGSSHSQPSWLASASPSSSDNSSQFQQHQRLQTPQQQQQQANHPSFQQVRQGSQKRLISTPQRLQQMRESIMFSKQSPVHQTNQESPTSLSAFNSPSTNLVDFDYTDHRLSAAMATNAQISSSAQSDTSSSARLPRGHTTPTIVEEEEANVKPSMQRHHSSQGQIQLLSASLQLQRQQQQQSPHQYPQNIHQLHHQNASNVMIRSRPQIRPDIYQQYTPFASNNDDETAQNLQDCTPFIQEVLSNYLATPSRLGLGERSVLIMTSKVAQKSYGQEKRFLCPPPMVLLVGSSWWSSCHDGSSGEGNEMLEPTVLTPPRLSISMSGEGNMQECPLEWASNSGRLIDVGNPSSEMAISGRSIGRQLFINDSDEKRRHCEALIHITVPGLTASDRKSLGTFASKPIKVISKPSKKRQSTRQSDLSVNHGSTISLFHRLRSQTVSTRYLCVSGAPTWFKGSDGEPFLKSDLKSNVPQPGEPPSSCFVAKMSSWDPFIIYLVDPHVEFASTSSSNITGNPPPIPGFPPPPINVFPLSASGQGPPICYNQAVVLQCLNTAVVSPIMVIRKVDRGTTVVGGSQSPFTASAGGKFDPSLETLGDPVSQLHKIAFEVLEDPNAPAPIAENREMTSPGQSGHFLGCLNEDVGLRKPLKPRQWVTVSMSGPSTPTTPLTPMSFPISPDSNTASAAAAQAAAQTRFALSQNQKRGGTTPSSGSMSSLNGSLNSSMQHHKTLPGDQDDEALGLRALSGDEDGGKSKRPRRVSSSVVVQKDRLSINATKVRRRGQSLSILGMQNQLGPPQQLSQQQQQQQHQHHLHHHTFSPHHQQQQAAMQSSFAVHSPLDISGLSLRRTDSFANSLTTSETSSLGVPNGSSWSVDVHDSDIWTIVGTDIARHTFYVPNKLVGGIKTKMEHSDQGIAHLINVPAPASSITPMPVVHSFTGPKSSSSSPSKNDGCGSTARPGHKATQGKGSSSSSNNNNNNNNNNGDFITLTGENFNNNLFIYFGDWRSTRVMVKNATTIYCDPPPALDEFGSPRERAPIIIVRSDGVIFPTSLFY
ncbi:hypothetical protein CBS101457_003177 [Exobasidium rhododendri]|nr:hypothetical protein CBS101457_003177 [Exobasidium rhododendri]